MPQQLKILLLEDSRTDAEIVQRVLLKEKMNCEFRLAMTKKEFLAALDEFNPAVILSDNSLPQFSAAEALQITQQKNQFTPFILVTGTVSEEYAANIIRQGADDYILKDRMTRLPAAIVTALNQRRVLKELKDYKYALDQSAIVAITDQKGIILYANENFCKISKYTAEELIGQDHRIINSGYHPASFIKNQWRTIANGQIWRGEYRNRAKDGSIYWVDTYIIPLLDEKGKPYQYLSIRTDISEKKRAEQELRTAHNHLSFLIENSSFGFIEWNNQLSINYMSKRVEEIFGWTESEFISLLNARFGHVYPDDVPLVSKIAEQLINGEVERNNVQYRNYTKDGRLIWCEWFNSVLKDKEGNVDTILSLVRDITENKKAEEELLQSQMRLKQAQQIAHLGNWEVNFENNTSKWSEEVYRIYGLNPKEEELSFAEWLSYVHPSDREYVNSEFEKAATSLSRVSLHHRILRPGGELRHVYTESNYEFNKEGKPVVLYGISHDVTENKKAEEEIKKSNERFEYATRATSDIIWELNFETKQYLVHEGNGKFLGYTQSFNWQLGVEGDYIVDEDRDRVRQSFREAKKNPTRELWQDEYKVRLNNGIILQIINHAIFVRDKKGKATRVIGAITDITDKKRLETDLLVQQRKEQVLVTATALRAQEKERNLIGQELHDNVNQILVGTKLFLSLLKEKLTDNQLVITCIDNIQQAIDENRKIAHALVTPDFESSNLTNRLSDLAEKMLETAGLTVQFDTSTYPEKLLDEEQKLVVYRVAQEQFTNIIKYAKARLVTISLTAVNGNFYMVIADDGIGVDNVKKAQGIGLRNIKGRLGIFNGSANIRTAPGKGFVLEIKMPLTKKE